jgi:hypothetical protein
MRGGPGTGTPQSALFPRSVFRFLQGGIPDGFRVKESATRPGMVLIHNMGPCDGSHACEPTAFRSMKKILIISFLALLASILFLKEHRIKRPSSTAFSEGCVFCHDRVSDPDPSHPVSAFGCSTCHLGNAYSLDRKRAHFGMARNPGDLRVADRTCGKVECHGDASARVKKSVMATNRGILRTIQSQWLKMEGTATEVPDLMIDHPPENLALDHYRKMCGGCHLWKERGDRPGEVGRRGGGCSDCHILDGPLKRDVDAAVLDHPRMTTRIPSENCAKCHNRSARIALSYFGRYESAGYGTPYEGRGFSKRRLSGNRFFIHLEADIHFAKAGMSCVDCHTAVGIMGDGKSYDRMEDQVDIACRDCHEARFSPVLDSDSLGNRLGVLNRKVPPVLGRHVPMTRRGTPLYNIQKVKGGAVFYRKLDGRPVKMNTEALKGPHHGLPGHERLSCQACHSAWIPQCYGCHLTVRKAESQRDWISKKRTSGRWRESRSYMRFAKPALGFRDGSSIYPVSPCQVFVSFYDEKNHYRREESFNILTLSAFDPHTTTGKSRACKECHGDPKVMGLGEGVLFMGGSKGVFRPTYDSVRSELPASHPLDAYVTLDGKRLQRASRKGTRPFAGDELEAILSVNSCLGCHKRYDDSIYVDFSRSRDRFQREDDLPCRK